jgi:probable phosphoglycerate mutase
MKIWVARHGETAPNIKKLFTGKGNPPLLPKGRETAGQVAALLKQKAGSAEIIYSSPLLRARQTAKIIAKELGLQKIVVEKGLREQNFGKWEGKTRPEVEELFPGSVSRWLENPYSETPAGGEDYRNLKKRLAPFAGKIRRKKGEIIVVAHANVIRVLPTMLIGMGKKKALRIDWGHGTVHLFDTEKKTVKSFKAG